MPLDPIALKTLAIELAAAMPPIQDAQGEIDFKPIDVSPRARTIRAILRIADAHGWRSAVVAFLEGHGVPCISFLSDPQLEELLDRMNRFVDAAETGCSVDDFPAF